MDTFYNEAEFLIWQGHRVLSVDGSRLQLPNHPTVKEAFGEYLLGRNVDKPCSMALVSMLYDTLNHLTLDARIERYSGSEGNLLRGHFDKLMERDLLLLDRGYPSLLLMYELLARKVHFCMRMKESWWSQMHEFSQSGKREVLVTFELPAKKRNKMSNFPEFAQSAITYRLIRQSALS